MQARRGSVQRALEDQIKVALLLIGLVSPAQSGARAAQSLKTRDSWPAGQLVVVGVG